MKNECSIVRDLLPLYAENMVSDETVKFINEHLEHCPGCTDEFETMKADEPDSDYHSKLDSEAVKSMQTVRRKYCKRGYLAAVLIVIAILCASVITYFAMHWITTVSVDNMDGISRQATAYLQSEEPLYIQEIAQRGNFLAALCATSDGKMAMCVFDKDPVFKSRWKANGGKFSLTSGEISSWNYGSPDGEAVLIFCGGEIPEEVCWYTFTNGGIIYTCPVADHQVLDIFIIQDRDDINGYPVPLDKDQKEIK